MERCILLVSAIASGQGKTTVTAALVRKLVRQGLRVRVFKTGSDFIDPMLLEQASGLPVYSLDLWVMGWELCQRQIALGASDADVILIEGVMGLYDGTPSSADLARAFGIPVMMVIDASAMAQTAGAVMHGLRDFGPVNLAGVVANRVGNAGHASMIADALRDIPLLAYLPAHEQTLPERHLGLVLPDEMTGLEKLLDDLAGQLVLDETAWNNLPLTRLPMPAEKSGPVLTNGLLDGATIAIARDAAFAFLYPANVDCLHEMGARICYFSPLADEPVPADATAVYLPGGYPELHAPVLSCAQHWQDSIRKTHSAGIPILAECGGMMVLAQTLVDQSGREWPMAGLLPGRVAMQAHLAGIGPQGLATPQGELRGHTFHYSRCETSQVPHMHTFKYPPGKQDAEGERVVGEAVYRIDALTASYFHAYFPSCPQAVATLLTKA